MRQEAIVCFQRALQVRPDLAMAYGVCYAITSFTCLF